MGDFEENSLKSLKDYLDTLESVNSTILSQSLEEENEMIEGLIQSFSCAFEILHGLSTPEEIVHSKEQLDELVHKRTKCIDSVIMGYIESMKLLHDAFFLSLIGRYATGRMILRGVTESMIRGLFYYGLTQRQYSKELARRRGMKLYLSEVSRILKMHPKSSPVNLQNHMFEWLKHNTKSHHPSLKYMVRELIDWNLWFRAKMSFEEFWDEMGFGEVYSMTSGFVHTSFGTTYTYFESILGYFQARKFWGCQFSKDILKIQMEGISDSLDFIVGLLLNAFPLDLISGVGTNRLNTAIRHFTIIHEKMPLTRNSLLAIISHKKKLVDIIERIFASQDSKINELIKNSVELLERGKLSEAVDFLTLMEKTHPNNPVILHYLGLANLEMKNLRKSLEYFDLGHQSIPPIRHSLL